MKFTDTLKSLEAKGDETVAFAYLCGHAQEIINLVEAAENSVMFNDPRFKAGLIEALAALNKE